MDDHGVSFSTFHQILARRASTHVVIVVAVVICVVVMQCNQFKPHPPLAKKASNNVIIIIAVVFVIVFIAVKITPPSLPRMHPTTRLVVVSKNEVAFVVVGLIVRPTNLQVFWKDCLQREHLKEHLGTRSDS